MERKAPAPENEHVQEEHDISMEKGGKRNYKRRGACVCKVVHGDHKLSVSCETEK